MVCRGRWLWRGGVGGCSWVVVMVVEGRGSGSGSRSRSSSSRRSSSSSRVPLRHLLGYAVMVLSVDSNKGIC